MNTDASGAVYLIGNFSSPSLKIGSTVLTAEKDGGIFKFRDYSESIKTPFEIGKMTEPSRFRVEDVQFAIWDAYQALGEALKHD